MTYIYAMFHTPWYIDSRASIKLLHPCRTQRLCGYRVESLVVEDIMYVLESHAAAGHTC